MFYELKLPAAHNTNSLLYDYAPTPDLLKEAGYQNLMDWPCDISDYCHTLAPGIIPGS